MTHLHDLSAHLDDIGLGEGFGDWALGVRWQVGVIEEGLWGGRRGHEMDEVIECEWRIVVTHVRS